MAWLFGGAAIAFVVLALVDRLTEAPIMRRHVNTGTDRYRASMDYISADEQRSIFDIQVGSGSVADPLAKRLPIPKRPPGDGTPREAGEG